MSYNLFLDDTREPPQAFCYDDGVLLVLMTGITDWVIARDYRQFEFILEKRGMPTVISFDHDLHFEHVKYYMNHTVNTGLIEYERFKHKTGKHCAELVLLKLLMNPGPSPRCYVHSANDVGRKEIRKVLARLP